jgi:hypothetical protein
MMGMRGMLTVLGVILGMLGCVSPDPGAAPEPLYTYRVDASIVDKAAVREAASALNARARRLVFGEHPDGFPIAAAPLHGLSGLSPGASRVVVDEVECARAGDGHTREYLVVVLMHEMGHVVGMEHHAQADAVTGSIMSPNSRWYAQWTELDQRECERVGVCISH